MAWPLKMDAMPTEAEAAHELARTVRDELKKKPELVLAVPTGKTPLPLYRELARLCAEGELSFRKAHTFALDELKGVEPEDPGSFHAYLQRHFYRHVDVHPSRIHFFDGVAEHADAQCRRYERELAEVGGIDIAILGIGNNGHIAFNEPAPELPARTHVVKLARDTRETIAALFGGDATKVPTEAYTMGLATLLSARHIALMATGTAKADILARALRGPISTHVPASFLQLHPNVSVFADDAARAKL